MPVGAVGAICAANRTNRNRSMNKTQRTPLRSTTACKYSSATTAAKQAPAPVKASEASETVSVDSKPSILSMFKSQVSETSGFFKKQKDALAEKVQKGLKMTSVKKDVPSEAPSPAVVAGYPVSQPRATQPPAVQRNAAVNPAWISSLEQMGFEPSKVQEAIVMVGGQPEQMDDLLQVLVAMHASNEPPLAPAEAPPAAPQPAAAPLQSPVAKAPTPPATPPPLPPMSAVGSADFEMASSSHTEHRFLGRSGVTGAASSTWQAPTVQISAPTVQITAPTVQITASDFEVPGADYRFLGRSAVGSAEFEAASDRHSFAVPAVRPTNSPAAQRTSLEQDAEMCSPNTAAELVAEIVNEVAMCSLEEALGSLDDAPCPKAAEDEETPELVLEVEPESPTWDARAQEAAFTEEAAEQEAAFVAEKAISEAMLEVVGEFTSKQDLAKAVVASVIAGASKRASSRETEAMKQKHMADETPLTASPVKGGA